MAVLLPISSHARHLLSHPPAVGEGRHVWLFKVGISLHRTGWGTAAIARFLKEGCRRMGWEDRSGRTVEDILAKIDSGFEPQAENERLPDWPDTNHDKRHARSGHRSLFDAAGDSGLEGADVLPRLFRPRELVCVGWEKNRFMTMPLEQAVLVSHAAQFIVPNPMTAETAPNGSRRCKANSSHPDDRRYAVIEFDTGEPASVQASVLSSLHTGDTPLVMAVWSAGKSIHGWFNVAGLSPHQKLQFFRFASLLGADHSLFDMSKLVRMPGGLRNGDEQTIIYFEEEHL